MNKAYIFRDFSITYELAQIIERPTHVFDATRYQAKIFRKMFTRSLGTSVHSLISVQIEAKENASPDLLFRRTIFPYTKAEWDSFRSYTKEAPLLILSKHAGSKTATLVSEWILFEMESFIHLKVFQQKPNSQLTPECASAIAHRNQFFNVYH